MLRQRASWEGINLYKGAGRGRAGRVQDATTHKVWFETWKSEVEGIEERIAADHAAGLEHPDWDGSPVCLIDHSALPAYRRPS